MTEPYEGYAWIKVKAFKDDSEKSLEERFEALQRHHDAEATFLINKVRELGKCEAILQKVVDYANDARPVIFEQDFGGNTITVYVGKEHTHCGIPRGELGILVDNLYNALHGGPGLEWVEAGGVPEKPSSEIALPDV